MAPIVAARKCQRLIFVPPRFDVYSAVSALIREIFGEHTDLIEPLSLDEADAACLLPAQPFAERLLFLPADPEADCQQTTPRCGRSEAQYRKLPYRGVRPKSLSGEDGNQRGPLVCLRLAAGRDDYTAAAIYGAARSR